ncbi:MAG TPA: TIGR00725 family protein [Solirubrobacteraceae bacterium]|nr:TIGR00725 family protein [Solirubrobacteraceae bacterium]
MPYVAVVGPGEASPEERELAEDVGQGLGRAGAIIVCGGLGGVMAAACRGASTAQGTSIGILPGTDRAAANDWVTLAIPTGLGELRNGLVVRAADVVIAIGGGPGTLSEIALALKTGVPVVGIATWQIDGVEAASGADGAVKRALELAD